MDIEVRLAGENDLGIIHEILSEIQKCEKKHRAGRLKEALDSDFSTYLVAVTGDRGIGYLNIWYLPDLVDGGKLGIILDCYVLGEFRRRGVGKMLMEAAMEMGKKQNVNKYFGWTDPGNKTAIGLLKQYGFSTESLMLEKK
jgi:GNAT superfamily N-acetyltransferase